MKFPIKPNGAGWPSAISRRLAITSEDPRLLANGFSALSPARLSAIISVLKFGTTFKTTNPGRHEHSNRYLLEVYRSAQPSILDIGASDGSTALDLVQTLRDSFRRYFATDLNLSVRYGEDGRGVVYFADHTDQCVLRVSKRWLVYADVSGAWFPLGPLAQRLLTRAAGVPDWREVLLIQPELLKLSEQDPRIVVTKYDMFVPWTRERPDLIKMANVLNPSYFSDRQLVQALRVQCSNLAPSGRLLIADNRDHLEKFSVFYKTPTGMRLEYTHAGGADASVYVPGL
jgi:hypothetical protein